MIRCKTCDTGELLKRKKYRMSGMVVFIGYILLVPSVLGILVGGIMLVATGAGTGAAMDSIQSEAQSKLEEAGISRNITTKVLDSQPLSETDRASLNSSQRQVVDEVKLQISAGTVGAGLGVTMAGGVSVFVMISSLVGGLLGWLLVMKKKVLQCTHCGVIAAAS